MVFKKHCTPGRIVCVCYIVSLINIGIFRLICFNSMYNQMIFHRIFIEDSSHLCLKPAGVFLDNPPAELHSK